MARESRKRRGPGARSSRRHHTMIMPIPKKGLRMVAASPTAFWVGASLPGWPGPAW